MPDMKSTLDRIVAHLRRLGRGAPDRLQDGLSKETLDSWESRLSFALTGELETIYSWRNGTKADAGVLLENVYLFPGFYFLSIEEAVEVYEEREDTEQWRAGWFPLFADGGGDFYVVPCQVTKVETAEMIGFIHGEPVQTAEYESLTSMVETLDACFREGAFYVDDDDTMEIDDEKHRHIANRFNPTISEWQS